MFKHLSPKNGSRVRTALLKLAIATVFVMAVAISASAYTLVFRDGRRMEIPDDFTVTKLTLTYEMSPGFNRTIEMILIDVAATERVNNEAPGGLFKHTEAAANASPPPSVPPASRTLTNGDLTAIRQRRIESEQNYEARRKE